MDTATLVRSDLEIEGLVMEALSRARMPVRLCDWNYVPQLDEWQLIIATPWYDSKGPRESYSRVIKAFQDAGIYQDVPMRRVFLRSPEDALVKALEQEIRDRKEGAIHILEYGAPDHNKQYSVIFAPFAGPGGAVPAKRFASFEELRGFLDRRLHIRRSSVDEALAELTRRGSASIFHVQLTTREARKLGLA